MRTDDFTKLFLNKLELVFPRVEVVKEWDAAKKSGDDFNHRDYYSPRVDIAIGPFNENRELVANNRIYNLLVNKYKQNLLKNLYSLSHLGENREYISYEDYLTVLNNNPRCFIAVEIENTKDAKRSLGDIVNASVMGKVGIVIPIGRDKYELFIKIKKYFHYLEQVGKLQGNFNNVLIIEGNKLIQNLGKLA